MPRLGSLVLAGVLLGVPRALQTRAFGAQGRRAMYVEVSRPAPELGAFAEAFTEALAGAAWSLAPERTAAAVVVDVVSVLSSTGARGRRVEAYTVVVREGRRVRRLVLEGHADDRRGSARELIHRLSRAGC